MTFAMTYSNRDHLEAALTSIGQVVLSSEPQRNPTPAQQSVAICLNSAAALLDVAHHLLRSEHPATEAELVREWQALIGQTKAAGRHTHQAVVLMASQSNMVAAQHGITVKEPVDATRTPSRPDHVTA